MQKLKIANLLLTSLLFSFAAKTWTNEKDAVSSAREASKNLYNAVIRGDIKEAEKALQNGADVNKCSYPSQVSPLATAIMLCKIEMVKFLLTQEARTASYKNSTIDFVKNLILSYRRSTLGGVAGQKERIYCKNRIHDLEQIIKILEDHEKAQVAGII